MTGRQRLLPRGQSDRHTPGRRVLKLAIQVYDQWNVKVSTGVEYHWLDAMQQLQSAVRRTAHGILIHSKQRAARCLLMDSIVEALPFIHYTTLGN